MTQQDAPNNARPYIGKPMNRIDGRLKVTGKARYAAEWQVENLAYGFVVESSIAKGKIAKFDSSEAEKLEGVLAVYSHANKPKLQPDSSSAHTERLFLLQDNEIHYAGQIIGLVVADTFEVARHAASLVKVLYEQSEFVTDLDSRIQDAALPDQVDDEDRGDFEKAFTASPVKIEATYTTPMQTHNALEPFACIAQWDGDALTLHDSTQAVIVTQSTIAEIFRLKPNKVRVLSPFVGGGFGSKLTVWSHVPLAVMAAKSLNRPVKIVVARSQMYGPFGCRPATVQYVKLGAFKDGQLEALQHQGINETSRFNEFTECVADAAKQMYACENVNIGHRVVKLDIGEATWMRAPGHATGSFALECALDELANKLDMDPIELRLKNFAEIDHSLDMPWSSNNLRECYRRGAEMFGWNSQSGKAGTKSDGKIFIGHGMATALHPMEHMPASARAVLKADGTALVQCASQDIGTGTYTIMTQIAADALSLTPDKITFELGDSSLPEGPMSGGSTTAGNVGSAVANACFAVLRELKSVAAADSTSPLYQAAHDEISIEGGRLQLKSRPWRGETYDVILNKTKSKQVEATVNWSVGISHTRHSVSAFGAQFAEVRVDPSIGKIQVSKFVGTYDIGRILNQKTARSQLLGGIGFGIGMALMEHTWIDHNFGRIINADIAEYHLPVHPDIGDLQVEFIETDDNIVNVVGAKGAGEIGITGAAAAIANAVFNATGKRIRNLPITLDDLI